MGEPRERPLAGESFLARHGVSTAAAALGVFLLAKCFAASNFSTTTASALLTAAPVGVLLGTLTSTEYFLWPWLAAAAAGVIAWYIYVTPNAPSRIVPLAATAVFVLACFLSVPAYLGIALGIAALIIASSALWSSQRFAGPKGRFWSWRARLALRHTHIRPDRGPVPPGQAFGFAFGIPLAALGLGFLLITLSDLWLPSDGIIFRGPQGSKRVVVGHVIEESSAWTTVLRAGDRRLERVPSKDVLYRRICVIQDSADSDRPETLMALFLGDSPSSDRSCADVVTVAHERQSASYVCGSGLDRWERRRHCGAGG